MDHRDARTGTLKGTDMPQRFTQIVFSNPTKGKEAEFNEWYDTVHIPQLLEVPGMLSAKRFALHDCDLYRVPGGQVPEHGYMCVYQMEGDVNTIMSEIRARVADGRVTMSDCLDLPSSRMSFWTQQGDEFVA